MRISALLALAACLAGCRPDYAERDAFLAPVPDVGAHLPADGIWPKGRKVLVAGYSGVPARDLAAGFSVAGPHYGGGNEAQIAACRKAGLPVIAQIGPFPGNGSGGWEAAARIPLDEVRRRVAEAVRRHASTGEIVMWAIQPEELRPWRKDEMAYLKAVAETVRKEDPLGRPLFLYNPNHRDAASLAAIVPHLDVIGKGCYANIAGHKGNRAWIRWSVEQMVQAAGKARPGAWAVVMPELAKDPEPAERPLIRTWVRHDTYLGMMSGAKGVFLWSLFPRREVKTTWKTWYDAYAECGRELNGERQLGAFFLFGQRRDDLAVTTVEPRRPYPLGSSVRNALEASTTQPGEGKKGLLHPWTKAEYALGAERVLFLANSCPEPTTFRVAGLPSRGLEAVNAFDGKPVALDAQGQLPERKLGPWEVAAYRFRAAPER
jgi:hypothetical protein